MIVSYSYLLLNQLISLSRAALNPSRSIAGHMIDAVEKFPFYWTNVTTASIFWIMKGCFCFSCRWDVHSASSFPHWLSMIFSIPAKPRSLPRQRSQTTAPLWCSWMPRSNRKWITSPTSSPFYYMEEQQFLHFSWFLFPYVINERIFRHTNSNWRLVESRFLA